MKPWLSSGTIVVRTYSDNQHCSSKACTMSTEPSGVLSQHNALLEELRSNSPKLSSPKKTSDRSSPFIDPGVHLQKFPKEQLMHEIEQGVPLHHLEADAVRDASIPMIEKDVVIKPNMHGQLMQEVRSVGTHHAAMAELKQTFLEQAHEGGLPLKHVTTVDKAAPHISPDVHLSPDNRGQLLAEVLHHPPLQHVDPTQQHDTSSPRLVPGVGLDTQPDPRAALLQEVRSGGVKLHHVTEQEMLDKSAPAVSKTAAMRVAGHSHA